MQKLTLAQQHSNILKFCQNKVCGDNHQHELRMNDIAVILFSFTPKVIWYISHSALGVKNMFRSC